MKSRLSRLSRLPWLAALAAVLQFAPWYAAAAQPPPDSAVILIYHRVADGGPASTRVTPATFAAHLDYLAHHHFHVVPLSGLLQDLDHGRPLPPDTVALTFDDAYASVYTAAYPLLRRRGWPFTVFVATDYIDRGYKAYATWAQLREMAAHGAELGDHSRSHAHLVRRLPHEDEAAWAIRVKGEIEGAQRRLREEAGAAAGVFAYPYGESTPALESVVAGLGLYAVGQQSGAVGPGTDLRAAPRFPMAGPYADPAQFALKVHTRPLPVTVLAPADGLLGPAPQRPALRLRLGTGPFRTDALRCYASGQGAMDLSWSDGRREVSVRPRRPLTSGGRYKYNCTAPAAQGSGVYFWYSYLWMKRNPDGSWYRD